MRLNVPKEQALKVLRKRLSEIDDFDFEAKSWKDKTQNDIMEIFNNLGKSLQVSFITFETPVTDSKKEVLQKGKKQARELIKSFIESIEEYVSDYDGSLVKKISNDWTISNLRSENKKISNENEELKRVLILKNNQIAKDKNTISKLVANTVQLDKLTLSKLFGLITSLPIQHSFALGTIVITILSSTFFLGSKYQETFFQEERYELNRKYETIQGEKSILLDSLQLLKSTKAISNNLSDEKVNIVIFNSNNKAVSINFENISKNNNQIKSHSTSVPPNSFGRIKLDKANYKYEVKRFIDYKKALTESKIYIDSILRIGEKNNVETIHIR